MAWTAAARSRARGEGGGRDEAAAVEIREPPPRGVLGAIDGDDPEAFGADGLDPGKE